MRCLSLKNKLNRLKPHLSTDHSKKIADKETIRSFKNDSQSIPFFEDWEKEKVKPFFFDGDYCLVREVVYPLNTQFGRYQFSDFIHAVEAWNNSAISHPLSSKGFAPNQLFFFDTETTGLGGGTGNTIFLLGHASIEGETLVLKQHILPHPGAEVPLYKSFLENVNYTTLVTYNGKAFDWPQVKTRHTLIREHVPRLPSFGHFDLFHAARRLWKHKLDRLKLSIVEKEVLQIQRVDDVPGYLAPMIYFDFVERKNPEGMLGILKHNEMDILSLVTLYTHLSYQLLSIDETQTVKEKYEVGRWFAYLKDHHAAKETFSEISSGYEIDAVKAKYQLSLQYKKSGEWDKAIPLWKEISGLNYLGTAFDACIELAKIYEHKQKNINKALYYTEKAKKLLAEKQMQLEKQAQRVEEVNKRLERVRKKQSAG